jgi:broad specificity phosphatase PhoE
MQSDPKDPGLTMNGLQRAEDLKNLLIDKKIGKIYSTQTKRTMATAQPLSIATNIQIETYPGFPDKNFINSIKKEKKNTLIVGHSNTVDDIVNLLTGQNHLQDLPDPTYNQLFIVHRRGKKYSFEQKSFGATD